MPTLTNLKQILIDIHPWLLPMTGLLVLLIVAWLVNAITKHKLLSLAHHLAKKTKTNWDDLILKHGVIKRASQLLPATVIYFGVSLIPELSPKTILIIKNFTLAYVCLVIVLAISSALNAANSIYEQTQDSGKRPIKGYIQVAKLLTYGLGSILIISALIGKSPLILLSGFGALTAILLLVFKDTILSLVASVQLSSLDMVRVGDWIEMPKFNADGDVIDVALHTIRVQNWDKTITTIPSNKLISDSFRNWRGMSESGGRRIKRALLIDMTTVRFLQPDEISNFSRFALLKDYVSTKQTELAQHNAALEDSTDQEVNLRRLTNLGTFRAYVFNYLKSHPEIHKNMTLLVRQLQTQTTGVPVEIYCFTTTTDWGAYEKIQGDIFDHLMAIMTEFDLKIYQQPSGSDFIKLLKN